MREQQLQGYRRFLDPRIVLGIVLMAGSVLAGVRLLASAEPDQWVWAASSDLASGTEITADDLQRVAVSLPDSSTYLPGHAEPAGRLANGVAAGELLPRSSLASLEAPTREVAVSVAPDRLGPGVTRGSLVDVWATPSDGGTAAEVAVAVLVDGVITESDWSSGTSTVVLRVSPEQVGALVTAGRTGDIDLVAVRGPL